jgi:hypothetical protein
MIPLPRTQSHKVTKSLQQATNTLSPASEQDCLSRETLSVYLWPGGARHSLPHSLSTYILQAHPPEGDTIGHQNHAQDSDSTSSYSTLMNPFKGMVMVLSERAPSHNIDHQHSTSIEEQAVAAALNTLNRIGSHNIYRVASKSKAWSESG